MDRAGRRLAARRLRYPVDDLVRLVALEAARHRALAIGEDLGTVPAGFRERLGAQGIAGMRVLWFERDAGGAFRPPSAWDRDAIAMPSTHDLPTVAGWWRGVDLAWRRIAAEAAQQSDDAEARMRPDALTEHEQDDTVPRAATSATPRRPGSRPRHPAARRRSRRRRRACCTRHRTRGAVASVAGSRLRAGRHPAPPADSPPVAEILAYVARSPSPLAILPLEDLLALDTQPNLPGRALRVPNWRQRLPRAIDTLFDADVRDRIAAVVRARGSRGPGP